MNATVVQQSALRLVTAKSKVFPADAPAAFDSLEAHLKTLKGRKFYGVIYLSEHGIDYHAGLLPENEIEERRFIELGFPVKEIEGGACVRVKLDDWMSKTDQIGPTFGALAEEYGYDPSRPQLEFYRSATELHLLHPVQE